MDVDELAVETSIEQLNARPALSMPLGEHQGLRGDSSSGFGFDEELWKELEYVISDM